MAGPAALALLPQRPNDILLANFSRRFFLGAVVYGPAPFRRLCYDLRQSSGLLRTAPKRPTHLVWDLFSLVLTFAG